MIESNRYIVIYPVETQLRKPENFIKKCKIIMFLGGNEYEEQYEENDGYH